MSCLFKYDRYHRGGDQGPSFQRLNLDIEHLDLSEYILFQISLYPLLILFLCTNLLVTSYLWQHVLYYVYETLYTCAVHNKLLKAHNLPRFFFLGLFTALYIYM